VAPVEVTASLNLGVSDIGVGQISLFQYGTGEIRFFEYGANEIGTGQVGAPQIRTAQIAQPAVAAGFQLLADVWWGSSRRPSMPKITASSSAAVPMAISIFFIFSGHLHRLSQPVAQAAGLAHKPIDARRR
jgi:hypothetical protein